ncbi:MAG: hypothetical protein KAS29_18265, partial [Bacteroidales bacterium]|nr:hypothetical protein [Bacteroidales bacterium]
MEQKRKLQRRISGIFIIWLSLFAFIACTPTPVPVTPETALQSYLQNEDQSFAWELSGSQELDGVTAYSMILTSQKWREHIWKHNLTVIVPEEMNHDGALLFITGGKNEDGNPIKRGGDDEFIMTM